MPEQTWKIKAIKDTPTEKLILVKTISKEVSAGKLREFFGFCGPIEQLELRKAGDKQEALILFTSATAAHTAVLMKSPTLNNSTVLISYYFEQFNSTPKEQPAAGSHEAKANELVSEWIAQGRIITDQLLEKYNVLEKVDTVKKVIVEQVAKIDEKFGVHEKAQQLDSQYQITERAKTTLDSAVALSKSALDAGMQYPIVRKATEIVTATVDTATATIADANQRYEKKKAESHIPVEADTLD